jgi:hypothetical protein
MDLCYLYKLQIFILYLNKNIKNVICLRGAEKFVKMLVSLLTDFVFCCFEHLFESQDDSF